jgi:hypothetical protein
VRLADPAGDELRVLRAEVDDEDGTLHGLLWEVVRHLGKPTGGPAGNSFRPSGAGP